MIWCGNADLDLEGPALVLRWGLILLIPVTLQDNVTRLPLLHKRRPIEGTCTAKVCGSNARKEKICVCSINARLMLKHNVCYILYAFTLKQWCKCEQREKQQIRYLKWGRWRSSSAKSQQHILCFLRYAPWKIANPRKTAAICKICSFRSGFEENAVVRLHTLPPTVQGACTFSSRNR